MNQWVQAGFISVLAWVNNWPECSPPLIFLWKEHSKEAGNSGVSLVSCTWVAEAWKPMAISCLLSLGSEQGDRLEVKQQRREPDRAQTGCCHHRQQICLLYHNAGHMAGYFCHPPWPLSGLLLFRSSHFTAPGDLNAQIFHSCGVYLLDVRVLRLFLGST